MVTTCSKSHCEKIFKSCKRKRWWFVGNTTGGGKTVLALNIISQLKKRLL